MGTINIKEAFQSETNCILQEGIKMGFDFFYKTLSEFMDKAVEERECKTPLITKDELVIFYEIGLEQLHKSVIIKEE